VFAGADADVQIRPTAVDIAVKEVDERVARGTAAFEKKGPGRSFEE
jgi:hypothetical protein